MREMMLTLLYPDLMTPWLLYTHPHCSSSKTWLETESALSQGLFLESGNKPIKKQLGKYNSFCSFIYSV